MACSSIYPQDISSVSSNHSLSGRLKHSRYEDIWTEDVHAAFMEAISLYPPMGKRRLKYYRLTAEHCEDQDPDSSRIKSFGRCQLIQSYIYDKTGKNRTRKQVSSHLQRLKKMHRDCFMMSSLLSDSPSACDSLGSPEIADACSEASDQDSKADQHAARLILRSLSVPFLSDVSMSDGSSLHSLQQDCMSGTWHGDNTGSVVQEAKADTNSPMASYCDRTPQSNVDQDKLPSTRCISTSEGRVESANDHEDSSSSATSMSARRLVSNLPALHCQIEMPPPFLLCSPDCHAPHHLVPHGPSGFSLTNFPCRFGNHVAPTGQLLPIPADSPHVMCHPKARLTSAIPVYSWGWPAGFVSPNVWFPHVEDQFVYEHPPIRQALGCRVVSDATSQNLSVSPTIAAEVASTGNASLSPVGLPGQLAYTQISHVASSSVLANSVFDKGGNDHSQDAQVLLMDIKPPDSPVINESADAQMLDKSLDDASSSTGSATES